MTDPTTLAIRAPHGDFTVHVSDDTRTPDDEPAAYVICACGRGYSWGRRIPAAQLAAWLANHGPDIPLEEEERRVKEATGASASAAAAAAGPHAPRSEAGDEQQPAPERHIEFTCSICLYDYVDWSALDEDELASRNFLTVINGHMTCEYHASIAGGGDFGLKLLAAKQHGMRS